MRQNKKLLCFRKMLKWGCLLCLFVCEEWGGGGLKKMIISILLISDFSFLLLFVCLFVSLFVWGGGYRGRKLV